MGKGDFEDCAVMHEPESFCPMTGQLIERAEVVALLFNVSEIVSAPAQVWPPRRGRVLREDPELSILVCLSTRNSSLLGSAASLKLCNLVQTRNQVAGGSPARAFRDDPRAFDPGLLFNQDHEFARKRRARRNSATWFKPATRLREPRLRERSAMTPERSILVCSSTRIMSLLGSAARAETLQPGSNPEQGCGRLAWATVAR
jgi:hypothetical protein